MAANDRDARRARMQAATARRTVEDAPPAGRTAIRSKPVRITVDLNPEDYRKLAAWTTSTAAALDMPRVTSAEAVRAMIRATSGDPMVSDAVTSFLAEARDQ
jgi:hypothetical protein